MGNLSGDIADPVGAIVQFLLNEIAITNMVDKKVFGSALPPQGADYESFILVRLAGGRGDIDQETITYPRLEFRCYGLTDNAAATLYWLVYRLLNGQTNLIYNDTRFMSISIVSSGAALYDDTLNRPYVLAYADCMMQTEKISA